MNYDNMLPEFLAKKDIKTVNKRFDITERQYQALSEIDEYLKIPPSSIVRIALNCFLPKIKNDNFTYEGINKLWNENGF